MKRIFTCYLKPYYLRMSVGFLIKFAGTLMDLLLPWTLAHMIDVVIPANRKGDILLWGLFMVLCSVLAVTFNVVANRMASRVSSDAVYVIRKDLFEKVMYLSNRQVDAFSRPSLISRLTSDTYNVHQMLGRIQRLGVRAPILLIGGIAMTMILDPVLACILLATLPLLTLVVVLVSRKSIPMFSRLQDAVDRFVRLVREDIAGIRVIKALSKGEYERQRFDKVNREVVEKERVASVTTAITNPVMNILLNIGLVCVILTGAYRVDRGLSEVGKILAFMTYFTIILNALLSISRMFIVVSKAAASADRIMRVMDAEDEMELWEMDGRRQDDGKMPRDDEKMPQDGNDGRQAIGGEDDGGQQQDSEDNGRQQGRKDDSVQAAHASPYLEFDHVSFSYNKVELNLEDISFSLQRGETLGIIGATGSGKTTIVNLLMRFYDVDSGAVRIGGQDIRSMPLPVLRKKFGAAFQNDTIFEDTILENIDMGRGLGRDSLTEAVLYARAKEFVDEKGGLDETLDIKGANLSGGQKQRILIARALAAHPEILILDDSSSALDYKTDAALRRELKEHFADTTCVIVTQRISSIMGADHILVLEDGKAIGYGTHEELMGKCSVYQEIKSSQMGA